jgi:hypothetical protein
MSTVPDLESISLFYDFARVASGFAKSLICDKHSASRLGMKRLSNQKRVQVVAALVEGSSFNSIVRMTGVAEHTIVNP